MDSIKKELIKKINNAKEPFIIKIKVVPNSSKNLLEIYNDEIIKVKINKPAVDGKANKGIIEYLSKILNLPKSNIEIVRGEKSSLKDLRIVPKNDMISKW